MTILMVINLIGCYRFSVDIDNLANFNTDSVVGDEIWLKFLMILMILMMLMVNLIIRRLKLMRLMLTISFRCCH